MFPSLVIPAGTRLPEALADRMGFLLNNAAARIRQQTERRLAHLKISPRLLGVLETVATEGPLSQVSIGERLGIDRTTVVDLVDQLERARWVRRQVDPADRRRHAVEVTRAGSELLAKAGRVAAEVQDAFLAPLRNDERQALRRLLIRLLEGQPAHNEQEGQHHHD